MRTIRSAVGHRKKTIKTKRPEKKLETTRHPRGHKTISTPKAKTPGAAQGTPRQFGIKRKVTKKKRRVRSRWGKGVARKT